ncbi:MAG: PLP-dependent aminotransferase family protein [Tepidanaerobacteraceae bacterium]
MNKYVSIQIDRLMDKPLYFQICDGLIRLIKDGTLVPGEKLPSIRKMASFFDVNTVTVVNAYKKLETMGYVESRVGSGTYVTSSREEAEQEVIRGHDQRTGFPQETLGLAHAKGNTTIKFDFASASISPTHFPVKHFKQVINEILDRDGGMALEYQESSGYQPLRESIIKFMNSEHGLTVPFDELQIISGAQQGIDILAKAFLNYRDVVYVEAPTYPGALNAFKSRDAEIVEIKMEEDGVNFHDLKKNIKKNPPKIFYTMPVFQNPTGYSYSKEKKKELIALSIEYDFYVIEDDHISDLYYDEKPTLLKSFDESGKVFYIKSFSKPFLPGIRMAFLWIPHCHFNKTALAKYSSDISSSGLSQRAMELFLEKGFWSDHVQKLREIFRKKWEKTNQALRKYMPESVKNSFPKGGHFFWIQLPRDYYSINVYREAVKAGISLMPGDLFYADQRPSENFRLSIAQIPTGDIEDGIALLSESIKRIIDNPHGVFQGPNDRPLL